MELIVYGVLEQEFDFPKEIHFHKTKDIFNELFQRVRGLRERLCGIIRSGSDYSIFQRDGKIYLLPILAGFGGFNIIGWIASAVAVVAFSYAALVGFGAIAGFAGLGMATAVQIGLFAASVAFTLGRSTKPSSGAGPESVTAGNQRSTSFGSDQVVSQGTPIPLGYGHLSVLASNSTVVSSNWNVCGNTDIGTYFSNYSGK